ncbi:hypothetical protein HW42_23435 (plasmid) [Escherichia coli]|nr:hypothetical protein HW42_23435 [Escherichia coli]
MALATSALRREVFRVRHSSFTQPPVQTSYHSRPLLHGPLHGSQSLLSGTVILLKQLDTDIPASGLEGGDAG